MVFQRSPLLANSLNNFFTFLSTDDFDGFFGSTDLDSTDETVELTELLNWGCASSMRGGVGVLSILGHIVWVVRNGSCMGTISFEKNTSTKSRLFLVQGKPLKPVNMRSFATLACKNTRISYDRLQKILNVRVFRNKSGTAQVGAPLKAWKVQMILIKNVGIYLNYYFFNFFFKIIFENCHIAKKLRRTDPLGYIVITCNEE